MPDSDFLEALEHAARWSARYLREVGDLPVLARTEPGEIRSLLPDLPPEEGVPMDAILADFEGQILPGVTHWNHPAFHGYFAVTGSGPGIIGELLSATLNLNAMVWRASPAGTELEAHTLDWLRILLGLPEDHFGVIQDTASSSSLVALAAAREVAYPGLRDTGLAGRPRGRIYTSGEAHSSIDKAALTLGLGREGVRHIAVDDAFRMRPDALRTAIREDRHAGVQPVAIVATLGTTSTTSVDPIHALARIAAEEEIWLHVDAAYAGPVAMLPEHRALFAGWESADSIVVNPHKWLFTPIDCSVLYTRRPERVREAFSLTPEYLRTGEDGVTNLMDYGVALGRRFRALKLWMVIRYFGAAGLRERIRAHIRMAGAFAEWVGAEPGWEVVAPHPFATVVFRWVGGAETGRDDDDVDRRNLDVMEAANATGRVFISHTRVGGRIALRLSVGNLRTTPERVRESWETLREAAHEVSRE